MKTVFIILDTLRRDYLEAYGNTWVKTPAVTRLAKDGVVYDNHWVGSLPCMPARREFMTGRHNFIYRGWGPIEPYDDTLPAELRKKSIHTHLLTDHDHYFELGGENYHTAFNTWEFFRGTENDPWVSLVDAMALPEHKGRLTQQNWQNRTRQIREEDFSGPKTAAAAIQWLDDNKKSDNWFLQVEIFDPHEPFFCAQRWKDLYPHDYEGPFYDCPNYGLAEDDPKTVDHIRRSYAALVSQTDHWVGKILDKLQDLGLYEETLLVFTTDHGTMLAEHGYYMKNVMPLFNEIVRIPLIVKHPGNKHGGTRNASFTQTMDLMPTFLDFFGCVVPPHVYGKSLLANAKTPDRSSGIFGYFGMAMNVTDGRHVYMRNPVNADAGPLHAYTAMPIAGMNRYYPRSIHERMEMGRYFGHTYNLPLYKIPEKGLIPVPVAGEKSFQGRHVLYDVVSDPKQEHPIQNETLEKYFQEEIRRHLKNLEAPAEQYTRLGLAM